MPYEQQLIAIEDLGDVDLAEALAAVTALSSEGAERATQRSLMLGSLTARDGDLDAALGHLEAASASARGAGRAARGGGTDPPSQRACGPGGVRHGGADAAF